MKFPFLVALLGVSAMAAGAGSARAQMPFSSTQPPSPFNHQSGLPPVSTPVPRAVAVAGAPGAYPATGAYPGAGYPGYGAASNGPIDPDHKLGRGDTVTYYVDQDRDGKVYPLAVTDSGELELPLGGRVKVSGKTTGQAEADIKSQLEREYYYHATVHLGLNQAAAGASKGKVFFIGELATKGALDLPVDGNLTLSQAISQLGGFTIESDQRHVVILRKGGPPKGIVVDVKDIYNGQTDKDVVLQPGDTIKVKKTLFNIQM